MPQSRIDPGLEVAQGRGANMPESIYPPEVDLPEAPSIENFSNIIARYLQESGVRLFDGNTLMKRSDQIACMQGLFPAIVALADMNMRANFGYSMGWAMDEVEATDAYPLGWQVHLPGSFSSGELFLSLNFMTYSTRKLLGLYEQEDADAARLDQDPSTIRNAAAKIPANAVKPIPVDVVIDTQLFLDTWNILEDWKAIQRIATSAANWRSDGARVVPVVGQALQEAEELSVNSANALNAGPGGANPAEVSNGPRA